MEAAGEMRPTGALKRNIPSTIRAMIARGSNYITVLSLVLATLEQVLLARESALYYLPLSLIWLQSNPNSVVQNRLCRYGNYLI